MVVGIREYQPGDRLSWINWKASAKRNGMVTKEFETGQSTDVLLVMDSTPSFSLKILFLYGIVGTGSFV